MFEVEKFNDRVIGLKTSTEYNGKPIMWAYAYLIDDVLFDAGCANGREDLNNYAQKNGVARVYITHTHEDHVGACSLLSKHSIIFSQPQHIPSLKNPPEYSEFFVWIWGQPEPVDEVKRMGEYFEIGDLSFRVIELPGHCADTMVGFYEENQRWFFSSDGVPVPSRKKIAMEDENVVQVLNTLKMIMNMDIEVLFDSHRGPIVNPKDHIQKRIDWLTYLQNRSRELYSQGLSIEEIQNELNLEVPWYLDATDKRFGVSYLIRSLIFDK